MLEVCRVAVALLGASVLSSIDTVEGIGTERVCFCAP